MGEVAGLAFVPLFQALEKQGVPPERWVEGTGYRVRELKRPFKRIPWDDYAQLLERLEELLGDEVDLEEVTRPFPGLLAHSGYFSPVSWLAPPAQLYRFTLMLGSALFTAVEADILEQDQGHTVMRQRLPSAYRDSPQFFRLARGGLAAGPSVLGLPPAQVDMELRPRCAIFYIHHPVRATRLRRLWEISRMLLKEERPLDDGMNPGNALRANLDELSRAQRELRASEARWRALVQSAPDMIFTLDREGYVLSSNLEGMPEQDEVEGRRIQELLDPLNAARATQGLQEALDSRQASTLELAWRDPNGADRIYSVRMGPLFDGELVVGVVAVVREITHERRREAERAAIDRQVVQLQRMDSLGVLAGGMAHDFNNLLTAVSGNAEILRLKQLVKPEGVPYLTRIRDTVDRAASLTTDLLAFAGRGTFTVGPLDISALVADLGDLLGAALPPGVTLEMELGTDLPWVAAEESQLRQLVTNLVANAGEAFEGAEGRVSVRTRLASLRAPGPPGAIPGKLDPGPYLEIEVADRGVGIDERVREHMFEPFFSTRKNQRGLGLAAVLGIVRGHGGALEVDTGPGGTVFRVLLPTVASPTTPELAPEQRRRGGGRLLVVEDDPMVREAIQDLLNRQRYQVIVAEDGEQALSRFRDLRGRLDGVVLDMDLPKLSGGEVMRRIREEEPDLPVLLTTGLDAQSQVASLMKGGHVDFLRKPWTIDELLEAVSRMSLPPGVGQS